MKLAILLQRARLAKGWSNREAAEALEVYISHYFKMENGDITNPGLKVVVAMHKFMGIPWEDLEKAAAEVPTHKSKLRHYANSKERIRENKRNSLDRKAKERYDEYRSKHKSLTLTAWDDMTESYKNIWRDQVRRSESKLRRG